MAAVVLLLLITIGGALLKAHAFRPSTRHHHYVTTALPSSLETDTDSRSKPKWAGTDDLLSNVVNFLINSPLYNLMKPMARSTLISTAEKNSINWTSRVKFYESNMGTLEGIYRDLVSGGGSLSYPSYYTKPFHAYDTGNLEFKAAFEVESATYSMALRVWPGEVGLTAFSAQDRLRYSYLDTVKAYLTKHGININRMDRVIDVGCSAGVSTLYLAEAFKTASTIDALDLSPYFLAVAKFQQENINNKVMLPEEGENSPFAVESNAITSRFAGTEVSRINYILGNAENTLLESDSYELISISFMFHELPQEPTQNILNEMFRITSHGGAVAITDNNPRSKVIQNLPPALFTLMKSTEPWSDEYYTFDLEEALRKAGFVDVYCCESDPRHRTLVARKV